jgi:hypothetical protein
MRGGGGASGQRGGRAGRSTRGRCRREQCTTGSETGEAGADRWAPTIVPGGSGLNTIQIQMNSNYFKTFQTLTDPKIAFPSLKKMK